MKRGILAIVAIGIFGCIGLFILSLQSEGEVAVSEEKSNSVLDQALAGDSFATCNMVIGEYVGTSTAYVHKGTIRFDANQTDATVHLLAFSDAEYIWADGEPAGTIRTLHKADTFTAQLSASSTSTPEFAGGIEFGVPSRDDLIRTMRGASCRSGDVSLALFEIPATIDFQLLHSERGEVPESSMATSTPRTSTSTAIR